MSAPPAVVVGWCMEEAVGSRSVGVGASSVASSAILGISADYHDAAAALVVDGEVVAAAAEERFTRVKHDPSLPRHAAAWCLDVAGLEPGDLRGVAFYSKPLTTYERILSTHARVGPRGFPALARAVAAWSSRKLWVEYRIERMLASIGSGRVPLIFAEHHQSHAASAFYPSPHARAAIVTFDGVGEWTTTSIASGADHRIEMLEQVRFPNSLGLLYSAITAFCGFEVNDGEYKLMGLAPYGKPRFAEVLRERVVDLDAHGSFRLDQRWFDYQAGARMAHRRMASILDGPPRDPTDEITDREADIAASVQVVLEEAVLRVAERAHRSTGAAALCLAGGVSLNCVANRRLIEDGPFDDVWIQPASGDDGGALGAALWSWHQIEGRPRVVRRGDGMRGAALGPAFTHAEVVSWLEENQIRYEVPDHLPAVVASALAAGKTVGWFCGAMEFGPRALGHRSILADPRSESVVARINAGVKDRESFRPFAPAVLAEHAASWFVLDRASPYMLVTSAVHPERRRDPAVAEGPPARLTMAERLSVARSDIPACTHVDGSARVQTVEADVHPEFHRLLSAFYDQTGCPVLLNTSFNRAGEPIVRTPADAHRCFDAAGLDLLVLEGCVVEGSGRPRADIEVEAR